jgi:hypothetical protein
MKASSHVAQGWQLWDEAHSRGEQTQFSRDKILDPAIVTPRFGRTQLPLSTDAKHYFLAEPVKLHRSFRLDNGASGITSSMASRYDELD